jgi:membrane protease YdiL (CAAX protease family)
MGGPTSRTGREARQTCTRREFPKQRYGGEFVFDELLPSPVWIFLILAFALSWPFLLYGFGWFASGEEVLKRYLFSCAGMLMVAFSAFLTRVFIERQGFGDAGWRLGRCRWYLAAVLFCALLWLGPPLMALAFGKLVWHPDLSRPESLVVILSLAGGSVLAGFGEEFGWRGYLLPRLLPDRKLARLALLMVGVVWGVWHCATAVGPLLRAVLEQAPDWPALVGPTLVDCIQMVAASIALSFIFGAVWLRTRSVWFVSFLHGYWIGIRDATSLLCDYPSPFRLVTLVAVLAAWLRAARWLEAYQSGNAGADRE